MKNVVNVYGGDSVSLDCTAREFLVIELALSYYRVYVLDALLDVRLSHGVSHVVCRRLASVLDSIDCLLEVFSRFHSVDVPDHVLLSLDDFAVVRVALSFFRKQYVHLSEFSFFNDESSSLSYLDCLLNFLDIEL